MSPSPTLAPGLASTSPRISTGVPLGKSASECRRGMASRYFSTGSLGTLGSSPRMPRAKVTIFSAVTAMENLHILRWIMSDRKAQRREIILARYDSKRRLLAGSGSHSMPVGQGSWLFTRIGFPPPLFLRDYCAWSV